MKTSRRARSLWAYNIRILLGSSYWLIVAPITIAQLVFSWNLATAGLNSLGKGAQTIEVLAPLLGALLCAYAVAPEHAGVGELVFVRPISLEKLLLLRLIAIFGFVLVLLVPPLVVYHFTVPDFPAGAAVLAALVSALFLSALSMAVASATRQPLAGLGVAGAYWAFDLLLGTHFNPLLTLHGYSDYLSVTQLSALWLQGKGLLLLLAAAVYLWNRGLLGRPAAPRRVIVLVRSAVVVVVILFAYLYSGAACIVAYGVKHEADLGAQTWMWYRSAFQVYGPLPVPYLFGRAFPRYLLSEPGHATLPRFSPLDAANHRTEMEEALARYPTSIWADNIAYEVAHGARMAPARQPWTIVTCLPDEEPKADVIVTDEAGSAQAMWEFADAYPRSPFAPLALSQRAGLEAGLIDFEPAVTSFQRVLQDYPHARQAAEAGLALNALYLRQGKLPEAVAAARTAAEAAPWDVQPMAYLTAARTAQLAGEQTVAQECYRQARADAVVSRARAGSRAHGGESKLSPMLIIQQAEYVMNAADKALRGQSPPPPPPPAPSLVVTGQVLKDGAPLPGVRVALAQAPDGRGYPSPFAAEAAAQTATDAAGRFRLVGLAPGLYRSLAVALPGDYKYMRVPGLRLPLTLTGPAATLPPLHLIPQAQPPPPRRPDSASGRAPLTGSTRGRSGGGRGHSGGGRGGGNGTRGSQGRSRGTR